MRKIRFGKARNVLGVMLKQLINTQADFEQIGKKRRRKKRFFSFTAALEGLRDDSSGNPQATSAGTHRYLTTNAQPALQVSGRTKLPVSQQEPPAPSNN